VAQVSFGTILRETRERKGYDLMSIAQRLRIRPDILQTIEAGDLTRMPPRAYARNMINAYAHLLGLDSEAVTRIYLDEVYAEQVRNARMNSQPIALPTSQSGTSANPGTTPPRSSRSFSQQEPEYEDGMRIDKESGRMVFVEKGTSRYRSVAAAQAHNQDRPSGDRVHRSGHPALPTPQYTNYYAGPRASGGTGRLPIIIAAAVVLILLGVLLFFLFGPKGGSEDDLAKLPVTGLDDTGTAANNTPPAPVPPTMAVFVYEVPEGEMAWLDVYINDAHSADDSGLMEGPTKHGFDVKGTLRITTANPAGVNLFLDDVALSWPDGNGWSDEDGDGIWEYTVDFSQVLAKWLIDHPQSVTTTQPDTGTGTGTEGSDTAAGQGTE
jgi:hypothetical protein